MFKKVLEIYDPARDTWSRIERGNWKSERQLDKHIHELKKQAPDSFYFKCRGKQTNISGQYRYAIFDTLYKSIEKRDEAAKVFKRL